MRAAGSLKLGMTFLACLLLMPLAAQAEMRGPLDRTPTGEPLNDNRLQRLQSPALQQQIAPRAGAGPRRVAAPAQIQNQPQSNNRTRSNARSGSSSGRSAGSATNNASAVIGDEFTRLGQTAGTEASGRRTARSNTRETRSSAGQRVSQREQQRASVAGAGNRVGSSAVGIGTNEADGAAAGINIRNDAEMRRREQQREREYQALLRQRQQEEQRLTRDRQRQRQVEEREIERRRLAEQRVVERERRREQRDFRSDNIGVLGTTAAMPGVQLLRDPDQQQVVVNSGQVTVQQGSGGGAGGGDISPQMQQQFDSNMRANLQLFNQMHNQAENFLRESERMRGREVMTGDYYR